MPTLITTMFPPAFKRAATRPTAPEPFEPKPFIPTAPHVEHKISDTLDYLRIARCRFPAATIADYAHRFVQLSGEMRKLDEAMPSIMMTPNKPQTFPNIVVELARLIPADADGSLASRKDFLTSGLARSLTLHGSLAGYNAEQGLDMTGEKPSAAWVLRRAFRSFSEDPQALPSFVSALQTAFPENKWELTHILQDYLRNPKLRKSDVAGASIPNHP